MSISKINEILTRYLGIRISRARPSFDLARRTLIKDSGATFVIDGGANRGQWSIAMKTVFPELPILSIEPINSAFQELVLATSKYSNWKCQNVALSDHLGKATMNVASNGDQSSSLLKPGNHLDYYPSVEFLRTQEAELITLDSLGIPKSDRVYLKLDLQGHELSALNGAQELLQHVVGIELEMTTVEMYEGQATFLEVANFLAGYGFSIFTFSDAFRGADGQTIYLDVLFKRDKA
jgi:FkbM family methyltransferase